MTRPLFHFTAPFATHLGRILADKRIRTVQSNVTSDGAGPGVVWLTDDPNAAHHRWANGSPLKRKAVLEVAVPDAVPWLSWAPAEAMSTAWRADFVRCGGDPRRWFVTEGAIDAHAIKALILNADAPAGHPNRIRIVGPELKRLFRSQAARSALELPYLSAAQVGPRTFVGR